MGDRPGTGIEEWFEALVSPVLEPVNWIGMEMSYGMVGPLPEPALRASPMR